MRIYAGIFILAFSALAHGQPYSEYYPVQFGQYMRHYAFINPASIGTGSELECTLGSKNHLGNFSSISTYFADISKSLANRYESGRPYHVIGLKFDTDREGKYIARNRGYLMYAFHFRVAEEYYLSGGIDIGGLNLSVKGTPSTGDKSEFIADANSGIWFYTHDFHLGFSVNQIFNGKLQPYQETSIMRRHVNITGMKNFHLSQDLWVKTSVLFRFPSYINYNADYSAELGLKNITGGISLRHKLGGAFWIGIREINIAGGKLEAILSYNSPLKKSLININSVEIVCRYEVVKERGR